MPSEGPLVPATSADDASTGSEVWSGVGSPGNIAASDDTRATVALSAGNPNSHYLTAKDYPFATIPDDATVDGIEFRVEKSTGGSTQAEDRFIRLIVAGTIESEERAAVGNWSNGGTDATTTYGGPTDQWGHDGGLLPVLTGADVKDPGFGIAISAHRVSSSPTCRVDLVDCKVYYTEAGGGGSSVKSVAGVVQANLKKVSSVIEANVKKVSGVTN